MVRPRLGTQGTHLRSVKVSQPEHLADDLVRDCLEDGDDVLCPTADAARELARLQPSNLIPQGHDLTKGETRGVRHIDEPGRAVAFSQYALAETDHGLRNDLSVALAGVR